MKIIAAQNSKGRHTPYGHLYNTDTSIIRTPLYYYFVIYKSFLTFHSEQGRIVGIIYNLSLFIQNISPILIGLKHTHYSP